MSSATGAGSAPNPPSRVSFAAGIGRRGVRTAKDAFTGLLGGIVGLAPHVLHHFRLSRQAPRLSPARVVQLCSLRSV